MNQEELDNKAWITKCLIEPYEKMLDDGIYPYSFLDGWLFFDALYKMKLPIIYDENQRKEYIYEAGTLIEIGKDSDELCKKRIIKHAKHLAFKDWVCTKALEKYDIRSLISPKLDL